MGSFPSPESATSDQPPFALFFLILAFPTTLFSIILSPNATFFPQHNFLWFVNYFFNNIYTLFFI